MKKEEEHSKGKRIVKAQKAYDNKKFLHSRAGREIRILAEYGYPRDYFTRNGISRSIIFFGSARILSADEYETKMSELVSSLRTADTSERHAVELEIGELKSRLSMVQYYEGARKLAFMLASWSNQLPAKKRFHVCTGGGPGIMEAANRGAFEAGAHNIGLNISLPFEQEPNQYISHELNFEFHYFFMRKFWFVNLAYALVVFPGGFGTLDELMEILTLKQTQKISKPFPIFLYSSEYWKKLINFDYLVETKMIAKEDMDLFRFVDSPEEAFELMKKELEKRL